ncbi:helix-turn-helix domain-containing protein [Halobiforma nitratireducens]|uniref:Bacterio-opsin activator HTH domain protein n=1 Tax=Halobiforma nitratireducens JCM 10879 TaxID=1227454 RepID=M0L1N0_9EURY|nr:helix-turn-helix domain-containing protein [Halobiforma nitratireducens]EMA27456.1 Bacterio-opsin activator HTH domain protein [Halobiforma nitratireducens JCM 10879]
MSTIAELRLSATDTTLEQTFERVPDVTVELESSVSKNRPSLWVANVDRERIERAFHADPAVSSTELLVETDHRLLFDVRFAENRGMNRLYEELLVEGSSLLEAWGTDGWWQMKVRFPDREGLCEGYDRLVERGVDADLRRVSDVRQRTEVESRLTPEQREALEAALEYGYFEIPRSVSMEELADELGISHQALSERFRRAYETLVNDELESAGRPQ